MTASVSQPIQTNATSDNAPQANSMGTIPQDVGLIFVREYYTFLNKKPQRIHAFYSKNSVLVRGDEGDVAQTYRGQEEIRQKMEELNFEDCKVLVTQVDSQMSANDGILIQVLGEMCNLDGPTQKFSQTFFLAPQHKGYYVLNDIFRFLKEEVDIDYYACDEDEDEITVSSTTAQYNHSTTKTHKEKKQGHESISRSSETVQDITEPVGKKKENQGENDARTAPPTPTINNQSRTEETKAEKPVLESSSHESNGIHKKDSGYVDQIKETLKEVVKESKKEFKKEPKKEAVEEKKSEIVKPAPKQAERPTKSEPKSWASLASVPAVKNTQMTSAQQSPIIQSSPLQAPAQPTPPPPQSPQQPLQPPQQQPQQQPPQQPQPQPIHQQQQHHQQQHQHHHQQQIQQHHQQQHQHHHQQQYIFIKNVGSAITEENLREAFSRFGNVKSINIISARNNAFLEFTSADAVTKALAQHKVNVGQLTVLAEERRPKGGYARQQPGGNQFDRRFSPSGPRRGGSRGGAGGKTRGGPK
ncbi:hypothetical protein CLU79DRAFT_808030 [Phycomyces nitens]|nr:hypothetical protein CLU79DRAFT_808030 [Phycomyces nitens]